MEIEQSKVKEQRSFEEKVTSNKWSWRPSCITVLAAMVFWGQIQNYMMRVNLSILIVAMVKANNNTASDADVVANDTCEGAAQHLDTGPVSPSSLHWFLGTIAAPIDYIYPDSTVLSVKRVPNICNL